MATDDLDLELEQSLLGRPTFIEKETQPLKNETSFGDYIVDLVRAPVGGISDFVQGLIQLGAIPIDYVFDTNLTKNIDNFFNKWTPDAKTGIGEAVQTLVQFGIPFGVASKIGASAKILKGAQIKKLSGIPTLGGKGAELAKRAGYFGAIGGVTDFAVSVPGEQSTLSEALGLTVSKDLDALEGRERAGELLKQKLKFGAEGAVIGGAIPLLPAAGTLGYKYGISPVVKTASPVVGKVLTQLDKAVINPLAVGIAGKGTKSLASDIISKTGGLLDKAYTKTGLPPVEKWKEFDPITGTFSERILKKIDNIKRQFTSTGDVQFPEIKKIQNEVEAGAQAEVKNLKRVQERINNTLYNALTKFKTNIYDVAQFKATRTGNYTNVMDQLTTEKNKIFDYLLAQGKEIPDALKAIHPSVRSDAKTLKNILVESNKRYGKLISGYDSYSELANALKSQADGFFKQRYAAFTNKSFEFDPVTGPVGSAALKAVKNIVKKNPEYRRQIVDQVKKDIGTQGLFTKDYKVKFDKAVDDLADARAMEILKEIKGASIRATVDPDQFIKRIGGLLKTSEEGAPSLLKPGETFPDAIRRFLNQERNAKVPMKDYEGALVDTVMYQAKQYYSKNYFDGVEKILRDKGVLFNKEQQKLMPGLQPIIAKHNPKTGLNPKADVAFESTLFDDNYTLPEIANALVETKVAFDNFFTNPFYKNIMSVKAGAQIAKTIFSPMTQIRNVSTASFFPLMNGLIGGRSSLSDSWKLVAEDIFTGAKTNIEKLNLEIEDMIRRGVIDQNIQVNEMRGILNKAKDGLISFESFMNNPTVKKFVDVYQGGDNIWKVYSDKFYQSALGKAFSRITPEQAARGLKSGDEALVLENIKDWYRTVAKEDYVSNSLFTGQTKTAEEALKEVSAYLVTNTIPTYSKVPQIIGAIRNLPLGNFVAFPAEILRTTSNVLTIGARELTSTNPYIRQMGARRIIGASATLGGIGKITSETAQFVTGVDEDKMNAAKRSFVPVYEKNATLIPLSAPDIDGKFKYFNFSYSNPYDSLVRPFNAILGAFADGSLSKDSVDEKIFSALVGNPVTGRPGALFEFFSPFMSESIGTERITDVTLRGGESVNGSKVFYPQDPLGVKINKSLNHIIGGLEPGAFTQARRVWEGATGTFTDAGTARSTLDEITALMSGIRVQEVKPLSSMPFILSSYSKDKQNIGGKFAREVYSARTTPEESLSAWKTYVMESYDSQTKMFNTIQDARNLGIDEFEIKTLVQDRLKNKNETDRLMMGQFKPPNYSKERFKSLIRRVANEDLGASFRLEDNISRLEEVFGTTKNSLNFYDLNQPMSSVSELIDSIISPDLPGVRRLRTTEPVIQPSAPAQGSGTLPAPTFPQGTVPPAQPQTLGQQFNLLPTQQKIDILFGR
jgi:hypothetical protein